MTSNITLKLITFDLEGGSVNTCFKKPVIIANTGYRKRPSQKLGYGKIAALFLNIPTSRGDRPGGRRRAGEEGREKDGRTEAGRMDGRTGGWAEGRTDGRRTGGEFREERGGRWAMGKVVRFWLSKKTRGRFNLNKACGSK
jgi:hypothetical protein